MTATQAARMTNDALSGLLGRVSSDTTEDVLRLVQTYADMGYWFVERSGLSDTTVTELRYAGFVCESDDIVHRSPDRSPVLVERRWTISWGPK